MERLLGSGKLKVPSAGVFGDIPPPELWNVVKTVEGEGVLAMYDGLGLRQDDPGVLLTEVDCSAATSGLSCIRLRAEHIAEILPPGDGKLGDSAISGVDGALLNTP